MLLSCVVLLVLFAAAAADLPLDVDCFNTNLCPQPDTGYALANLDNVDDEMLAEWLVRGEAGWLGETAETNVSQFLKNYNCEGSRVYCKMVVAQFNFQMNETDETSDAYSQAQNIQAKFDQKWAKKAQNYTSKDDKETRELERIKAVYNLSLSDAKERSKLIQNMTRDFNGATVCNYTIYKKEGDCTKYPKKDEQAYWQIDPTMDEIMATSSDYDLMQYIWEQWRKQTGKKVRDYFPKYAALSNTGAKASGYNDMGEYWRSNYITDNFTDAQFTEEVERLWKQVLPLYEELHAYVRHKLRSYYSQNGHGFSQKSTIPAHVLGNMWAQQWNNVLRITQPYEGHTVDVTPEMKEQNYTVVKMFQTAKDFFTSIGLTGYNDRFMNDSMIQNPRTVNPDDSRVVECYADSEDFYNGKDYGMTICTKVTMEDLITIHHEMGHINYFMEYSKQPLKFRDGANSGFHEAIGDTMALSATTVDHLIKIGLLKNTTAPSANATEQDINFLFNMALQKIAFLPFGYLIDQYRWKVFDGSIPEDKYQNKWWDMRFKYQGIYPPGGEKWTLDESLFDPGAKFHVDADVPYVRYFVSFIIQFQFHDALCKRAGGPPHGFLHRCDIFNNTDAGSLLKQVLELGASKPWPEVMEMFTGTKHMDASKLMKYFEPLTEYLKAENKKNNVCYGWGYKWKGVEGLNPKRCDLDFPENTLYATFTDMGTAWNANLSNHHSDDYTTALKNYKEKIEQVFRDVTAYDTVITIDDLFEVIPKSYSSILAATESNVGVEFTMSLKSGDQNADLNPDEIAKDFEAGANAEKYNFTNFDASNNKPTTPPSITTTTTKHQMTTSSTSAGSSSNTDKVKKIAIAALVVSCIVLAALIVVFAFVIFESAEEDCAHPTFAYPNRVDWPGAVTRETSEKFPKLKYGKIFSGKRSVPQNNYSVMPNEQYGMQETP